MFRFQKSAWWKARWRADIKHAGWRSEHGDTTWIRGCPTWTRGCPTWTRGCHTSTRGCHAWTRGCPARTRGCPAWTRGCPASFGSFLGSRCHHAPGGPDWRGCFNSGFEEWSIFIEGKFLVWIKPPFMPHSVISLKTVTVQFCVYLES